MLSFVRVVRVLVAATFLALAGAWLVGCSEASRLDIKCEAGDVTVCTQLGDMYANGRGVERNLTRAGQAYERACNGGAADVCNTLGEIVELTGTAEGGAPRAEQLFQKACEGGSSAGCLNLGLAAAARDDLVRAFALYEKSCTGGWAAGCHQVAASYEKGEGVVKDIVKAIGLYTEACDGEYVESCTVAANLYVAGDVVTKDIGVALRFYGRALHVYQQACEAGTQPACTESERLRTRMAILSAGQAAAPPVSPPTIK